MIWVTKRDSQVIYKLLGDQALKIRHLILLPISLYFESGVISLRVDVEFLPSYATDVVSLGHLFYCPRTSDGGGGRRGEAAKL